MDECLVAHEEKDRIKKKSGRPRKKQKSSGEYAEYDKKKLARIASTRELRIKFRQALGIKPYIDIMGTMRSRDRLRATGYTEVEIDRICPIPRISDVKAPEFATEEVLPAFEEPVIELLRNRYSTDKALYNVTNVVRIFIEDVIDSLNEITNRHSLIFYVKKLPQKPTIQMAREIRAARIRGEYKSGRDKRFGPKKKKEIDGDSKVRSEGEEYNQLMSIYNKEIASFKIEIFRLGCAKYYENAALYESCMSSLQHTVNKLIENKVTCPVNPLEEFHHILIEMLKVASDMFYAVHFGEGLPRPEEDCMINILVARDKILECVQFIKDNQGLLSRNELHFLHMASPNHNHRLWEL